MPTDLTSQTKDAISQLATIYSVDAKLIKATGSSHTRPTDEKVPPTLEDYYTRVVIEVTIPAPALQAELDVISANETKAAAAAKVNAGGG